MIDIKKFCFDLGISQTAFGEKIGVDQNYDSLLNRACRRMGKKIDEKVFGKLSAYWMRHTWATIAAELEIPKETIAAALGHGGNDITDIYIRFDQRKVDAANRKVIDYLNETIERMQKKKK